MSARPLAKAVKVGSRFKASVTFEDGRTHRPPVKPFVGRAEAVAYAERWIAANYEDRASALAEATARREVRLDAQVAHIAAGGRW